MPENRFFTDQDLKLNAQIILKDAEFSHLLVMKPQKGQSFELVNGQNELARALLVEIRKHEAVLQITETKTGPHLKTKIILAQALPKPSKLDFILEKGCELGVDEFVFFPAQFSEIKALSPNKQKRAQALLIASLKQSGRLSLPRISFLNHLEDYPYPSKNYFGDPSRPAGSFFQLLAQKDFSKTAKETALAFFVGPEKGFSPAEIIFLKTKLQALEARLSQQILRTETAALAAVCLLAAALNA
ncbi:MAG: RsmE family RNA methyltransferase [Parachlamydiales bacterium]|jgi:16S rRNA (uracil1498-N3)-methyltransferase